MAAGQMPANPLAGIQTIFGTLGTMSQALINAQSLSVQALSKVVQQSNTQFINTLNQTFGAMGGMALQPLQQIQQMTPGPGPVAPPVAPPVAVGSAPFYGGQGMQTDAEKQAEIARQQQALAVRQQLATGQTSWEQQTEGGFTESPVPQKEQYVGGRRTMKGKAPIF